MLRVQVMRAVRQSEARGRGPLGRRLGSLNDRQLAVGQHYDEAAYEFELTRLELRSPVERAMTRRYLERFVPEGSIVADVGVGAGHYDELLAERGCRLYLADVSERLLEAAVARLESCGLSARILDARIASATDLAHLSEASCDVALLLGPLYHLLTLAERQQAVHEARRILKSDGVLIAAACNRMVAMSTEYFGEPERCIEMLEVNRRFIADGILNPELAPTIGHSHFTSAAEFRALCTDGFEETALVGLESFTGCRQDLWLGLADDVQQAWLDLVEATAAEAEGIGLSEHFLFVGRRRPE